MQPFVAPLKAGLDDLQSATMWFMKNALTKPDNAGAGATDYMHLFGLVALGYMWALIAKAANERIKQGGEGIEKLKEDVTVGRAYVERALPETALRLARISAGAGSLMAVPAEALCRWAKAAGRAAAVCSRGHDGMPSCATRTAWRLRSFAHPRRTPQGLRMAEAFIYDHVRSPRGRGKKDGALHEVSTVKLAAHALEAIRDRNELDTSLVDDVILGCVDPVGEAGGDIARSAVFTAGYPHSVPGIQVNRYCASGLDAVNLAHAAVASGQHDLVIAGGVESMSRVGIGSAGNAWAMDPAAALPGYFVPQGISADLIATKYGFSRTDVDAYAVESQKRAAHAWAEGYFAKSIAPVARHQRPHHPRPRRAYAARHRHAEARRAQRVLRHVRRDGRLRRGGDPGASGRRGGRACAPCRQFVRHRRRLGGRADRLEAGRQEGRPEAAGEDPRLHQYRLGAGDHADRPGRRDQEAFQEDRHVVRRHRPHRDQRGLRSRGAALPARPSTSIRRSSTSTAARSPWAIRSARPAR